MEIHKQLQRNRLAGVVAVVTGISGPAGSAVARRFAAEGARLILAGDDGKRAQETLREIEMMGGTAAFVAEDARTDHGAKQITHAALKRYGRIDTLVHNLDLRPVDRTDGAADGHTDGHTDGYADEAGADVDLDIGSYFPLIFSAATSMLLQAEGSIVLTACVQESQRSTADPRVQATARAGLGSFIHAAATKLYPHGIAVNGVELEGMNDGVEATADDAHLNFVNAYRKARRFEDVAHAARFLASSEARGITGQVLFVSGGVPPAEPCVTVAPESMHEIEAVYQNLFSQIEASSS